MSLAQLVHEDGFAFVGDEFYADASGGQNSHRRATLSELKDLFQPQSGSTGAVKDHPGHWYESQLIHYGLPASKTKSVAKSRLFNAFNAGAMAVPERLKKMEAKLKKRWNESKGEAEKAGVQPTPSDALTVKQEPVDENVPVAAGTRAKKAKQPAIKKEEVKQTAPTKRKVDSSAPENFAPSSSKKQAVSAKADPTKDSTGSTPAPVAANATTNGPRQTAEPFDPENRFDPKSPPTFTNPEPISMGPDGRLPLRKQTARRSAPSDPGHRFDSRMPAPATLTAGARPPLRNQTARRSAPSNPGHRFDSRVPAPAPRSDDARGPSHWGFRG